VLVLDETGFLKQGHHSAGVARQYSGTAGTGAPGQIGIFLGDASRLGHALLDRDRSLPEEWTNARTRCLPAGIPDDRRCLTKPPLARAMLVRAFAAGSPATWGTGDSVSGTDRRRRLSDPTDLTASGVLAPQATTFEAVVPVAGTRWTMESGLEAATGDVGLAI
jgi:SRSO17 transposase